MSVIHLAAIGIHLTSTVHISVELNEFIQQVSRPVEYVNAAPFYSVGASTICSTSTSSFTIDATGDRAEKLMDQIELDTSHQNKQFSLILCLIHHNLYRQERGTISRLPRTPL